MRLTELLLPVPDKWRAVDAAFGVPHWAQYLTARVSGVPHFVQGVTSIMFIRWFLTRADHVRGTALHLLDRRFERRRPDRADCVPKASRLLPLEAGPTQRSNSPCTNHCLSAHRSKFYVSQPFVFRGLSSSGRHRPVG
jgi:hypothetical protein